MEIFKNWVKIPKFVNLQILKKSKIFRFKMYNPTKSEYNFEPSRMARTSRGTLPKQGIQHHSASMKRIVTGAKPTFTYHNDTNTNTNNKIINKHNIVPK